MTTRTHVSLSVSKITALPFTYRTTHTEAIDIFYRANAFIVLAVAGGIEPILRHQPLLLFTKHLEIRYTHPRIIDDAEMIGRADGTLSACLQDVVDLCPSLQRFSMSGTPDIDAELERVRLSGGGSGT